MNVSQKITRAFIVHSSSNSKQNNKQQNSQTFKNFNFTNFIHLQFLYKMSKAHPPELKKYMDKKVRIQIT